MSTMLKKKTAETQQARSYRARRKVLARKVTKRTGEQVGWVGGILRFVKNGKQAHPRQIPKYA